jgi:hypothetical protein
VADEAWDDPLDPRPAAGHGGRWNPPGSYPVLYLNEDVATARAQIARLLDGQPADPEDLDPPFVLIAAVLPRGQRAADAVTDAGLAALGLPGTYPFDERSEPVGHERCQPIGRAVHEHRPRIHGIRVRSAATEDDFGRELAWSPAGRRSVARPVGGPQPFEAWWVT